MVEGNCGVHKPQFKDMT